VLNIRLHLDEVISVRLKHKSCIIRAALRHAPEALHSDTFIPPFLCFLLVEQRDIPKLIAPQSHTFHYMDRKGTQIYQSFCYFLHALLVLDLVLILGRLDKVLDLGESLLPSLDSF
jgi:hypothetical protein